MSKGNLRLSTSTEAPIKKLLSDLLYLIHLSFPTFFHQTRIKKLRKKDLTETRNVLHFQLLTQMCSF